MGLERLACISQDVDNLFEVDTVQNIMKHIMKIAGVKYHRPESSISKTPISLVAPKRFFAARRMR